MLKTLRFCAAILIFLSICNVKASNIEYIGPDENFFCPTNTDPEQPYYLALQTYKGQDAINAVNARTQYPQYLLEFNININEFDKKGPYSTFPLFSEKTGCGPSRIRYCLHYVLLDTDLKPIHVIAIDVKKSKYGYCGRS
ncbi:hypothetical protein K3495_g15321 [Podosphaera aphanis]|nr:hypothetical protein K3495_g15321 [Podosphaera aphanis]